MGAPTITNGEEYFFPIIYEGNGGGQRVGKFVPFTDNGTIANSVIFNDADNAYLSRTNDAGDRDTFTISVWVKRCTLGAVQHIFDTYDGSSSNDGYIRFNADNTISTRIGSPSNHLYTTNRTYEDTSKWYHIMLSVNTGDSTAADRVKLYVDGDRITSFSTQTNAGSADDTQFNYSSATFRIGSTTGGSYDFDGYLAEFNQVDGTALTPDTFGVTDTSTGRWVPKALTGITYGTNGFRLQFGSSSNFGDDTSGNTNDFSVSNLVAGDQTTDSPTQNHAILSSTRTRGSIVLSEGNLKITSSTTNYAASATTLKFSEQTSQGFYFEVKNVGSSRSAMSVLIMRDSVSVSGLGSNQQFTDCFGLISRGGGGSNQYWLSNNGSNDVTTGVAHASDDYIQVAFKDGKVWYGVNNTWIFSGNPATGANPTYNQIAGQDFRFLMTAYQNNELECNFGQKSFNYTPPTGFVALQQDNLPTTDKGVSGLTWTKNRDGTDWYYLVDSSRGNTQALNSNDTAAEETHQDGVQKFLKGGISVEDRDNVNKSGNSFVNWTWVCNGGTTETNNDGDTTVTLQKNTTAGFSIGTFTSTVAAQTCGHGLGATPEVIILKCRSTTQNWMVYHKQIDLTDAHYLHLNATDAEQTGSDFGNTLPTSTVFTTNVTGTAGRTYCFWAWTSIEGFSKFGKYQGNGSSDGPFIYTGFKPAWVMVKSYSNSATGWEIRDNKRSASGGNNPITQVLYPYLNSAEVTTDNCDFLSNGFKWRSSGGNRNESGYDYIYMAFAEHPFVGDGTNPVTAR